jgi:predicted ATP-grasp superfamily ATP-dependent carboligase
MTIDSATPVLLLGGGPNSLSVARNYGRAMIDVRISGRPDCPGLSSRYCRERFIAPYGRELSDYWRELLLTPDQPRLFGHIIIALCDESISFVCQHRDALAAHYILEDFAPALRLEMLDKKKTLERARAAGVPAPNFWAVHTIEDLEAIRDDVIFPVLVKPIHSHLLTPVFGCKHFIINDSFDEVVEKAALAFQHGLEISLVEMIPGPDNLLSSYYCYIDADGRHLFHYTKSVIRRYPINQGGATYHQSEWLPETAAMGQKFFASMPWRGMANIEFKRDPRDGRLKLIEVNPRFTSAHKLIVAGGMPIDMMIYQRLTGQTVTKVEAYDQNLRLWTPMRDILAFLQLRRRGELSLSKWLGSIFDEGKIVPMFSLDDPVPSFVELGRDFQRGVKLLTRAQKDW